MTTPSYYTSQDENSTITCLDAIEAMGQMEGFCKGNIIKYLWRHGRKVEDPMYLEDLKKAQAYLNEYVAYVKRQAEGYSGKD